MQPKVQDRLRLDGGQPVLAVNEAESFREKIGPGVHSTGLLEHAGYRTRRPFGGDQRHLRLGG